MHRDGESGLKTQNHDQETSFGLISDFFSLSLLLVALESFAGIFDDMKLIKARFSVHCYIYK